MTILTVVGARPNFMKAAPIIAAIDRHNRQNGGPDGTAIRHVLVHTGQHYDDLMSGSFFSDLGLPRPDVSLSVGSGSHAVQTGEIMKRFEPVLLAERPDIVVVVGDVNSTLACALVSAKTAFATNGSRPLVAHVEAGLRSFDRTMPEEINRIVTDQVADLLFVTEAGAVRNLLAEGVAADRIHFVGNTMIDSLIAFKDKADASPVLDLLGLRTRTADGDCIAPYVLMTLHRPANVDDAAAFGRIVEGVAEIADRCPVVFPVHPRTRRRMTEFGWDTGAAANVVLTDPLGYVDFLCVMKHAVLVITDSGGVQEETTCLGIPCVTVRPNTERPVTVEHGTNVIAGTDAEPIRDAIRRQLGRSYGDTVPEKWDGHAAARIVDILVDAHRDRSAAHERAAKALCA